MIPLNYQDAFDRWVESKELDCVVEIKSQYVVYGDEILQFDNIIDARDGANRVANNYQKVPIVLDLGSLDESGLPIVYKIKVLDLLMVPQLKNSPITEVRKRAVIFDSFNAVGQLSDEQVRGLLPIWEESGYFVYHFDRGRADLVQKLPPNLRSNRTLGLISDDAVELLVEITTLLPEIEVRNSFRFDYHRLYFFELDLVELSINENKIKTKFDDFAAFKQAAVEVATRMRYFLEEINSQATILSEALQEVIGLVDDGVKAHVAKLAIDKTKTIFGRY